MASRTHSGVLWSHNDGGNDPGVFAIGSDGVDIGFHALDVDGVTDVEDIAIAAYGGTEVLYLADIGDNSADRGTVRVYRFAEPDPASLAPITEFEVLEYAYPDRPYNAETLLIDEADQRLVIVTKEQAPDADGLRTGWDAPGRRSSSKAHSRAPPRVRAPSSSPLSARSTRRNSKPAR